MLLAPRLSRNATRTLILLALAVGACGTPATLILPSPPPEPVISGSYTLVVTASGTCAGLSVTRFQWDVVAQYTTAAVGYPSVSAPLPAPAPTVELDFTYDSDVLTPTRVAGGLSTPARNLGNGTGVPIGGTNLKFNTASAASGYMSPAPDGRGQVTNGSLAGDIELLDANNVLLGTCSANDHQWSLLAR